MTVPRFSVYQMVPPWWYPTIRLFTTGAASESVGHTYIINSRVKLLTKIESVAVR
jgi:hypothetical protein